MKGADNDALQLREAFHESFQPSHACICSTRAYYSDAQAHHSHDQNDNDDDDFLHLDLEAFHGSSDAAAQCWSPLPSAIDNQSREGDDEGDATAFGDDKFGRVCDDHLQLLHDEAFHGSSDYCDVPAAPHCGHDTQSLSAAQVKGDEEAAVDHLLRYRAFHGCSDNASRAEAGRCTSSARAHPHCDIIRQQATSIEADHQCEDKKHSHADDHLHHHHHQALHESSKIQCSTHERSALRCRSSLAQAFSAEDYSEMRMLRGQSGSTGPLCGAVSERSHERKVEFSSCRYNSTSPCMQSLACSNTINKINLFDAYDNRANYVHDKQNIMKEPYNYKLCSTSYKYHMQEHNNSYIMRGLGGLAFKWRPTLGSFNMRSLFGGHLHKASSARVWVHEEETSFNLDAKLSTHTPPLCPHHPKPSITPSSHPKSITSDDSSENYAKSSSTYAKSPIYSPLSRCINGISTKDSPILTRFGSNLSGPLSGYSYCGSTSFNCASSSANASRCSFEDSLFCASSISSSHSSKSIDKKAPQEHKLKRLQGLFNGKHFNVHLFNLLGKSKQNHGHLSNRGNGKNARFIDRNCNVSYSFHEELPKDSIQGAIAHCKQSMATTKTSHDNFVLP